MAKAAKPANPNFEPVIRESFARQGLMGTIGAWLVSVEPGTVTIEVPHNRRLSQQQGFFHGGVVGAVADTAAGYAALSQMPAQSEVTTVEFKINFMRPAVGPLMRATGQVVRLGKTLCVVRAEVMCGPPDALELCAVLQATMMRLDTA